MGDEREHVSATTRPICISSTFHVSLYSAHIRVLASSK